MWHNKYDHSFNDGTEFYSLSPCTRERDRWICMLLVSVVAEIQ